MADLSLKYCGVSFTNPFVLPSGIITEIAQHDRAIKAGAGCVTLKSVTKNFREGNPLPRMWKYDNGMLNSVGLRNPGIEKAAEEIGEFLNLHNKSSVIIPSLFSTKVSEFVELVEKIVPLNPDMIELNLSCPNTEDELGRSLGMDKGGAGEVVKAVKKVTARIPVLAKLSPNVADIDEVARECEAAGADGIVAINSVGPGMVINIKTSKPYLGNKEGGVTGPGILPIAIRCVYDIYKAVKIPIIGMGGVTKSMDVIEMMLAGATLVGVGTATYYKGMGIFDQLKQEITKYMEENNIKNLTEIIGATHRI